MGLSDRQCYEEDMPELKTKVLYYGDNLEILRDYLPAESVDLVYLDPLCDGPILRLGHGHHRGAEAQPPLDRIDVTHLAITVMRKRLEDSFPGINYEVIGEPKDLEGTKALARQDRYQFQWWALRLVNALPQGGERKKRADEGIDGVISFVDDRNGKARRVIAQVKSGHVGVGQIRELKAVIGDENLGLFITLEPPTEPMRVEAASAGFHSSPLWERDFPRIQIFTVAELLDGKQPELPGRIDPFARAPRVSRGGRQMAMSESSE
jgi:site-specific DNA-methyltransferase (adenine-specific)